jgi:hypothetical protein
MLMGGLHLRCARHVMAGSSINTDAPCGELKLGVERGLSPSRALLNVLGSLDGVRAQGKTDTRQCQSLTRAWIWEFKTVVFQSSLRAFFGTFAFETSIP